MIPNYLLNLMDLARGRQLLRPLVAVFHLTGRCNLNCAYCEDYGARRPSDALAELGMLSLAEAGQVLAILRQATADLILTGGEPLLYPQLDTLVAQAKTRYHFRHLTLLTNGLLLSRHLDVLPYLDRLVISLDSLDVARRGQIIGLDSRAARTIIDAIIETSRRRAEHKFELTINELARDFRPYRCYPTLVPRVLPNGDLIYPCRPIERGQTPHGGRPCNLTWVRSWSEAIHLAADIFGAPPESCVSCFQQCYAEPSLLQARPLALLGEFLNFTPSRQGKIYTFAPG